MLPFGSLLTQLPLLIIGALYMLYLGFCAVNRSMEAPVTAIRETREKPAETCGKDKTVGYNLLAAVSKEKHFDSNDTGQKFFNYILRSDIQYFNQDDKLVFYHHSYCLFSRPPPFAG